MKMIFGDKNCRAGQNRRRFEEGYALMLTMFMVAISLTVLIATMSRLTGDADLNARNGQYNASLYAAEAAVERVVARMRYDYIIGGGPAAVSNNLDLYRGYYPGKLGATEDPSGYWSNFQFSDGQGHLNATYVSSISNSWGPLQSQFAGLNGWTQIYRVLSNAKQTSGRFDLTNAVLEEIQLISIPIFQFAIFYNGLMEFTWCATFTVNGRTHANGNIFVGSSQVLTFNSTVTTTGGIYKTNWDGHTLAQMTAAVNYNGSPGYSTNVAVLSLPIGADNTPAAVREVINLPASGEDPQSPIGLQRYYNKPGVALFVSNLTVTAYVRNSGTDAPSSLTITNWGTNSASLAINFPFLSVTNSFIDQRELSKTIRPMQIDVGIYRYWLATNSQVTSKFSSVSAVPSVLYAMDNRTIATNTDLFAVRLVNGSILPTNGPSTQPAGWTVATPNPLYVWGHYNLGPGGSTTAGNTDTSKTFPASLVSDALTILSGNWQDQQSNLAITDGSKNKATDTTVNAAILTGIVFSTDATSNHFSGGVMNLPRLLEDWQNSSANLTLNTSIVNLFDSVRATNWFKNPGIYYYAPTRKFSFDNNFTNQVKLPPATPTLGLISRAKWRVPPPNNVTYAGN